MGISSVKAILAAVVTLAAPPRRMRSRITLPFALAVATIVLTTIPARARDSGSPVDSVRYRSPDGAMVTITDVEQRSRIADIEAMLGDIGEGRRILFAAGDETMVIEAARLDKIALWQVANGGLTPGQIPAWKAEKTQASSRAAEGLRSELAALRAATTVATTTTPAAPPGMPGDVTFPDPMDWRGVRGTITGMYLLYCTERPDVFSIKLPNEEGRWMIIFQGDGTVRAGFTPSIAPVGLSNEDWMAGKDTQWIPGRIDNRAAYGEAGGRGPVRGGELLWSIQARRTAGGRLELLMGDVRVEPAQSRGRTCTMGNFSQY